MTTATGMCVAGYTGTPSRACQADGQWASTVTNPCVQMFCPSFQGNNANWPHAPAFSQSVPGECVSGYTGSPTRDCSAYGDWLAVSNPCTIIRCAAVTEGFATWSAADAFATIAGSCTTGYYGTPRRTCGPDGAFGEIVNPCQRIMCMAGVAGDASWPATPSDTTATGVCDPGWTGSPTRVCGATGNWGTVTNACTRMTCAAANDAVAQAQFPAANAGDQSVAGTCYEGTSGSPSRDCHLDGTWSETNNPCSTNPCPALLDSEHANWPSPDEPNTLVTGTCVAGYDTSLPPPKRMCNSNGQWSSSITNPCQPIYCTASTPGYAAFNAQWPAQVQAGTSASGTCVAGYSGTTSRACSLAGVWGTPSPLCDAIKCAAISNDGAHSSWPQTQAGQSASGSCLTGYEGSPTRLCSMTGQWETVSSPCVQKRCPAETVSNSNWNATLGGLSATGQCVIGSTGTVTRACSVDGVWGPISGACVDMVCPAETVDNVVWPEAQKGTTATGSCVMGYGGESAPTRACLSSGVWGSVSGECARIRCPGGTYENAVWPEENSMTNGVRGTCVAGWQGAPLRNCSATGVYSAVANPCVQTTCAALDTDAGAWPLTFAGTVTVQGECPAGSDGAPVRDCLINGTWTAATGTCIARSCQALVDGHVSWPLTAAGSSAAGTCDSGYSGSPSRRCSSLGEWESIANPCVQNVCPAVVDGLVEWPLTPALSAPVNGTCPTGYAGSPQRSCDASGNWGDIVGPCEAVLCPAALYDNADWDATGAGQETVGQCITGYIGTPRRVCLASGAWNATISSPCTIKYDDCPSETVGMTFFPSAAPGTSVEGNCATGYQPSPDGPPTRQCYANGTWEELFSRPCTFGTRLEMTNDNTNFSCPVPVSSGIISDLRWTSKTSNSVTLAWSASNTTPNTTFRVEVASLTGAFVVANFGSAF